MFEMDDYRDAFKTRYDNPNMTSLKIKRTNPRNSSLVKK